MWIWMIPMFSLGLILKPVRNLFILNVQSMLNHLGVTIVDTAFFLSIEHSIPLVPSNVPIDIKNVFTWSVDFIFEILHYQFLFLLLP